MAVRVAARAARRIGRRFRAPAQRGHSARRGPHSHRHDAALAAAAARGGGRRPGREWLQNRLFLLKPEPRRHFLCRTQVLGLDCGTPPRKYLPAPPAAPPAPRTAGLAGRRDPPAAGTRRRSPLAPSDARSRRPAAPPPDAHPGPTPPPPRVHRSSRTIWEARAPTTTMMRRFGAPPSRPHPLVPTRTLHPPPLLPLPLLPTPRAAAAPPSPPAAPAASATQLRQRREGRAQPPRSLSFQQRPLLDQLPALFQRLEREDERGGDPAVGVRLRARQLQGRRQISADVRCPGK